MPGVIAARNWRVFVHGLMLFDELRKELSEMSGSIDVILALALGVGFGHIHRLLQRNFPCYAFLCPRFTIRDAIFQVRKILYRFRCIEKT